MNYIDFYEWVNFKLQQNLSKSTNRVLLNNKKCL